MSEDNVTKHPSKDKISPKESAFKKIQEEKKNGLNSKMKKAIEEYQAADNVLQAKRQEVIDIEEQIQSIDKAKLDF